jgi:hypothetical protein
MSYNDELVSNKQKAVVKSITDLLEVLGEIDIDDDTSNGGEIVLDDGTIMTLSFNPDSNRNTFRVNKISVTNARLNLDVSITNIKQDDSNIDGDIIRLVRKKPKKITLTIKKKDKRE